MLEYRNLLAPYHENRFSIFGTDKDLVLYMEQCSLIQHLRLEKVQNLFVRYLYGTVPVDRELLYATT